MGKRRRSGRGAGNTKKAATSSRSRSIKEVGDPVVSQVPRGCPVNIFLSPDGSGFTWEPFSETSINPPTSPAYLSEDHADRHRLHCIARMAMLNSVTRMPVSPDIPLATVPAEVADQVVAEPWMSGFTWKRNPPKCLTNSATAADAHELTSPLPFHLASSTKASTKPRRRLRKKANIPISSLGAIPTPGGPVVEEPDSRTPKPISSADIPLPNASPAPAQAAHGATPIAESKGIDRLSFLMANLSHADAARLAFLTERETGFPKDIVVAFVEELDKAHQYFLFNKYLREECADINKGSDEDAVAYKLAKENEQTNKFKGIYQDDIWHAVELYISNLSGRVHENNQDPVAIWNPVYYLEYRVRQEGYVLDQELEVELDKLKKFAPLFYRRSFVCREPPLEAEARTVTVSNIAADAPEEEIRKFFKCCGCITYLETKSVHEGQIAHITFKDLSGAKGALSFAGQRPLELSKRIQPLRFTSEFPRVRKQGTKMQKPIEHTEPLEDEEYAPLIIQPKIGQDASSTKFAVKKVEDINSLYSAALDMYSDLRTYYSAYQAEHVKDAKAVEGYGDCQWLDWMGLEAVANGGYTVGGRLCPPRNVRPSRREPPRARSGPRRDGH